MAGANIRNIRETDAQLLAALRHIAPWVVVLIVMPLGIYFCRSLWADSPWLILAVLLLLVVSGGLTWLVEKQTHNRSRLGRGMAVGYTGVSTGYFAAAVGIGMPNIPKDPMFMLWIIGGPAMCIAWNIYYRKRGTDDEVVFELPKTKATEIAAIPAGTVIKGEIEPDTHPYIAKAIEGAIEKLNAENAERAARAAKARDEAARVNAMKVITGYKQITAHGKKLAHLSDVNLKVLNSNDYCTEVLMKCGDNVTPEDLSNIRTRQVLATKFKVGVPDVRIVSPPRDNSRATMRVVWIDALEETRWWQGPEAIGKSFGEVPITIGIREDMQPMRMLLPHSDKYRKVSSHVLVEGMNGSGKALKLDTPVPTPSGWTTMGDLKVGDVVFDERGKPTTVTNAWDVRYDRPCYEITFSDGSVIVADAEHQWAVDTHASRIADANQKAKAARREGRDATRCGFPRRTWPQVVTTETMAESVRVRGGKHVNYSVRLADALDGPDACLPVPPYAMGAWLGDGTSVTGVITCADPEIIAEIEQEGMEARVVPSSAHLSTRNYRIEGLSAQLRAAGVLGDKHIPIAYLRASQAQRRALLAGLLDTDGTCTKGGTVEFTSTREALAKDTLHLVASLGYKATLRCKTARLNGKDCGPVWTVAFTPADKVFRLPRKLARQVTTVRATAQHRYVTSVRPVPSVPVRCVAVDSPSHLFLVGETCIPTHNSNAAQTVIADGSTRPDVVFWAIDVAKGIQTLGDVAPALDWFVTDKAQARLMMKALVEFIIPGRGTELARHGLDNWTPEAWTKHGIPYLVVIVEEGAIIFESLGKRFIEVMMLARSVGIAIWGSIQRAQHDVIDTNARAQFSEVLCFGMKSNDDVFALPEEILDMGASPAQWNNKKGGMCYYASPLVEHHELAMPNRTFRNSREMLREVTGQYGPNMARLEKSLIENANRLENCYDERETGIAAVRRQLGQGAVMLDAPREAQQVNAAPTQQELEQAPRTRETITLVPAQGRPSEFDELTRKPVARPVVDFDAELGDDDIEGFEEAPETDYTEGDAPRQEKVIFMPGKDGQPDLVVIDGEEMELPDIGDLIDDMDEDDMDDPDFPLPADTEDLDVEGASDDDAAATSRPEHPDSILVFEDENDEEIMANSDTKEGAKLRLLKVLATKGTGFVFRSADLYEEDLPYVAKSKSWLRGMVIDLAEEGLYVERIDDPSSPDDGKYRVTEHIGRVRPVLTPVS